MAYDIGDFYIEYLEEDENGKRDEALKSKATFSRIVKRCSSEGLVIVMGVNMREKAMFRKHQSDEHFVQSLPTTMTSTKILLFRVHFTFAHLQNIQYLAKYISISCICIILFSLFGIFVNGRGNVISGAVWAMLGHPHGWSSAPWTSAYLRH